MELSWPWEKGGGRIGRCISAYGEVRCRSSLDWRITSQQTSWHRGGIRGGEVMASVDASESSGTDRGGVRESLCHSRVTRKVQTRIPRCFL